jgi:hypothetical protein
VSDPAVDEVNLRMSTYFTSETCLLCSAAQVLIKEKRSRMRHSVEGIKKWRSRAIFIDMGKTRITVLVEEKKSRRRGKISESLLGKPLSNVKPPEGAALRRLSIAELLSGTLTMLCFVIFVFIKMFQLEIQSQESVTQLDTYATLSVMIGITFLVTFSTSMVLRRVFPGDV